MEKERDMEKERGTATAGGGMVVLAAATGTICTSSLSDYKQCVTDAG
jgi:hypothetical protein